MKVKGILQRIVLRSRKCEIGLQRRLRLTRSGHSYSAYLRQRQTFLYVEKCLQNVEKVTKLIAEQI